MIMQSNCNHDNQLWPYLLARLAICDRVLSYLAGPAERHYSLIFHRPEKETQGEWMQKIRRGWRLSCTLNSYNASELSTVALIFADRLRRMSNINSARIDIRRQNLTSVDVRF